MILAVENGIKYAILDETYSDEAFEMMTKQFKENEPISKHMQISLEQS